MSLPALATALLLSPVAQVTPPPSSAAELADPLIDPAMAHTVQTITRQPRHARGDPFEHINRLIYRAQMRFDRKLLRPVALGYLHLVPGPIRRGLRHIFANVKEPAIAVNYLLQLKPGKAAETVGRFLINSTLGVAGVFDVANEPNINLPHRPNGLSDTLGYYGVKPGPYIFLPLLGPTTLRDMLGGGAESVVLPTLAITPFDTPEYQVTRAVTSGLDRRAQADADLKALLRDAVDPYATFRSAFLQDREGEIANLHGHKRDAAAHGGELSDPLADPGVAGPPTDPAEGAPKPDASAPELGDPLTDPASAKPQPPDAIKPLPSAAPAVPSSE